MLSGLKLSTALVTLPCLRRVFWLQLRLRRRVGWSRKAFPSGIQKVPQGDGRGSQETNQGAKKMGTTKSYSLIYPFQKKSKNKKRVSCIWAWRCDLIMDIDLCTFPRAASVE